MAARTKFSVSSFNLYNLNIPLKAIYNDRDGWSDEEYRKKISWTASKLLEVNSQVWCFEELWHKDALNDAFIKAGLDSKYELLTPTDHLGTKIVCAAAVSKGLLVGEPKWIKDFPPEFKLQSGGDDAQTSDISVQIDSFSRPVLMFQIKPRSNGKKITIFVAHFKSKAPTRIYREKWFKDNSAYYKRHSKGLGYAISTIRRTAEAAALRMIITEETKDTDDPVLVVGDLNDGQLSNTLNILTGQPRFLVGDSKGGSDTDLYSVSTMQGYRSLKNVYYTHIYQDLKESLDHILVSQEFYDNSRKRLWLLKEMKIFNDHLHEKDHKLLGTGDHGIVKAEFEYRKAKR